MNIENRVLRGKYKKSNEKGRYIRMRSYDIVEKYDTGGSEVEELLLIDMEHTPSTIDRVGTLRY